MSLLFFVPLALFLFFCSLNAPLLKLPPPAEESEEEYGFEVKNAEDHERR